jgi:hypothetical protein
MHAPTSRLLPSRRKSFISALTGPPRLMPHQLLPHLLLLTNPFLALRVAWVLLPGADISA